jgi:hypothetical protein
MTAPGKGVNVASVTVEALPEPGMVIDICIPGPAWPALAGAVTPGGAVHLFGWDGSRVTALVLSLDSRRCAVTVMA